MPYALKGKCVHKQNADGSLGPRVPGGCHKTVAEAKAHMRALYSAMKKEAVTAAAPDHSTGMMVAVYPHPDIAEQLAVDNGLPPEDLHCTLAYMGDMADFDADDAPGSPDTEPDADDPSPPAIPVSPLLLGRVHQAISDVARRHKKKTGQLAGLGQFAEGPDGTPIYAPVDVPGLAELHLDVMSALEEAGLPARTDHGHTPHVTLGYHTKDSPVKPKPIPPTPVSFDALTLKMGGTTTHYLFLGDAAPGEPSASSPDQRTKQLARFYYLEGDRAPDGRIIDPGATNFNRPPPLPIGLQTTRAHGHDGAVISGAITHVARFGNVIVGDGFIDLTQESGRQLVELAMNGTMQTWSPDMGDAEITAQVIPPDAPPDYQPDTHFTSCTLLGAVVCQLPAMGSGVFALLNDDGSVLCPAPSRGPSLPAEPNSPMMGGIVEGTFHVGDGMPEEWVATKSGRIVPASMASTKEDQMDYVDGFADISTAVRKKAAKSGEALPDGSFPIRNKQDLMNARRAVGRANPADRAKVKAHIRSRAKALGVPLPKDFSAQTIAACAGPSAPPAEWFSDPQLPELQQFITIEDDGRVFGHLCPWDGCHIGYKNMCISPPTDDDFSYFHHAQVKTDDGEFVATGPVALRGGHAPEGFSASRAQSHYDDPSTGIMDVHVGPDDHGIWFAGSLRADVTENDIARLRASGVSGDWREIDGQLRLIGICSVNTPGFPKVRLAASAEESDAQVLAIIGMGTDPDYNEECEDCFEVPTIEERVEALESENAYLRAVIASAGLEDKLFDEMEASLDA